MLKFNKAFGRLGNTMICVMNGIKFCEDNGIEKLNYDVADIPTIFKNPNEGIIESEIEITTVKKDIQPVNGRHPNMGGTSHTSEKVWEAWLLAFYRELDMDERRRIAQQYLIPKLRLPKINISLGDNDLVIHVRGGDIFRRPHSAYIQPPVAFYKEIIQSRKWNKIIVISEDNTNPLTKAVLNCSEKVEFLGTMESTPKRHGGNLWGFGYDFAVLLQAKNLVLSFSSMSPLLLQLSNNVKKAYIASYYMHMTNAETRPNLVREPCIWWGRKLDSTTGFKTGDCDVVVLDYDDYANYPKLYDYKDPKVVDRLLNYNKT